MGGGKGQHRKWKHHFSLSQFSNWGRRLADIHVMSQPSVFL